MGTWIWMLSVWFNGLLFGQNEDLSNEDSFNGRIVDSLPAAILFPVYPDRPSRLRCAWVVMRALGSAVHRSATRLWANQATNWAALWTNPVAPRVINPDLTLSLGETLSLVKARQQRTNGCREGIDILSNIGQGLEWKYWTVTLLHLFSFSNGNPRLLAFDAMLDLYWIYTY